MPCEHLQHVTDVTPSTDADCEDCLRTGGHWVHLRLCMDCGHVGCCDSSPGQHARAHAQASDHPVVQSFEPGEEWFYCWPHDEIAKRIPGIASHSHT